MSKLFVHIGKRVGNVVAIGRGNGWKMLCRCDCGATCLVQGGVFIKSMQENRGLSCGCIKKELISKARTTHGLSNTPTMRSWSSMLERCYVLAHKSYKDYGGRGITVCNEWRESFSSFYASMGIRPKGKTIGRIDNDKGYSPENCEWQTHKFQSNNRRSNRKIEYNGETRNLCEWANIFNIPSDTLWHRLKTWNVHDALTTPVMSNKTVKKEQNEYL